MLTEEQNRLLTQVGPGTRMGNLLRRYWMPIAAVSEFEGNSIKPVRLFGEDLVLFKDLSGTFGLVARHCAHRRADLSYGFVEECGIRCNYHGWLFSEQGRCLEQPFEDTANPEARFKDKVRLTAYPVEAKAGLLWAYLGPQPAPLVPNWEPFTWKNSFVQIVFSKLPCNWLQCQENSLDPIHFEWIHHNWTVRLNGAKGPYGKKHLRLDFKEFEWGFTYHRFAEGMEDDHHLWQHGRVCLWPNGFGPLTPHMEFRVPIDDENTLSVRWQFARVPKEQEPYEQTSIPAWEGPTVDPATGRAITSHVMNQDFIAWTGQGRITDRTQEALASSDRGIILMRKRFLEDLDRIERGEDPKAIIRDPVRNAAGIELPVENRRVILEGLPLDDLLNDPGSDPRRGFPGQAGQPAWVRAAYLEAMGLDPATEQAEGGVKYILSGESAPKRMLWS